MSATAALVDVGTTFDRIFDKAMRSQPDIQHIVLASTQGLVIAYKSRIKGGAERIAALAPVVSDAGETMFNELGLAPLEETMLLSEEGIAYLVRCKSHPCFLLISAQKGANIGLLRLVAQEVEASSDRVLVELLR